MDNDDDAFYSALQAHFRTDSARMEDHFRQYLPHLVAARAGTADRPIIDLGCGNGEFLDLLKGQGLEAVGYDSSPAAITDCRRRNLVSERGELLEVLSQRPNASAGAISLMHVAEHLPPSLLRSVIKEAARVLARGGLLIIETPNPENLTVGVINFRLDPTHQQPIPPQYLQFVLSHYGYEGIRLLRLSPWPRSRLFVIRACRRLLNYILPLERFFGHQDYAVLGCRP